MGTTWVIAADKSRARIFQVTTGHHLEEMEDMVNPAGREADRELVTDAKGRYFGKGERDQAHTAEPEVAPGQHETDLYIKRLAHFLDKARVEHRFEKLRVLAPPKILGLIRENIGEETRAAVKEEFPKEVVQLEPREIEEYIRQHAQVPGP
jgi:protein required for attachment to host cells